MTAEKKLIVQKYGGATLADPEKIKRAAKRVFDLHQSGTKVVVVVSAMGQTTNELIELAKQVSPRPQLRELDMLLTVGERISMSLVSMALNDLGCPAISFTGSQAGILTDESHVNANIIDVKAFRVEEALKENKVVILAGFQGVSPVTKEITTLGRGGSDTSAVAMAGFLKADRCEILKDVDCVYTADPKLVKNAQPIRNLNYHQLLEMTSWGAKVLHHRSVEMAQQKNVKLYVGPASNSLSDGTTITSHYEFNSHKPIAVNTFSQVFHLILGGDFMTAKKSLAEILNRNQIGQPQFLYSDDNTYLVTGPQEILNAIENFEARQDVYQIKNKRIASVSLTYSHAVTEDDCSEATKALENKKIKIIKNFHLMNSLHFFVSTDEKNEAIQILHAMI